MPEVVFKANVFDFRKNIFEIDYVIKFFFKSL